MKNNKISKTIFTILTLLIIASIIVAFSTNLFAGINIPTLQKGYKGPNVTALQYLLIDHGYSLSVDGSFGPQTLNTVKNFQSDKGLSVDGIVGPNTWSKLLVTVKKDSTHSNAVKALQYLLSKNHGYTITVDGKFGPQTLSTVKNFQSKSGISVDGSVGPTTWSYLIGTIDKNIAAKRFVNIAYTELEKGFKENNSNNITPYGEWYGLNGKEWCAMFVSWCANESGIINTIVPKYSYCPTGADWYKDRNKYMTRTSGYLPKSGDVIFFYRTSKERIGHTGIVVAYDKSTKTVYTIEGNADDTIKLRKYSLNNTTIDGYGVNDGTSYGKVPSGASSGTGGRVD